MLTHSPKEITRMLVAWSDGDEVALEELTPLVYEELHQVPVELIQVRQPEVIAGVIRVGNVVWITLHAAGEFHQDKRAVEFRLIDENNLNLILCPLAKRRMTDLSRVDNAYVGRGVCEDVLTVTVQTVAETRLT